MSFWWKKQRQITQQKLKYGQKVLTNNAILINQLIYADLFDTLAFLSDLLISNTFWSSLLSSFLYGIDLNNLIPDNIVFTVSLPDLQQWINGVLILLNKIDLATALQNLSLTMPQINLTQLLNSLTSPTNFLIPPISINLQLTQLQKAYYNQTAYGYGYYDPTAVTYFFRSTMHAIFVKGKNPASIKNDLQALGQGLNLSPRIVDDTYNRLMAIKKLKEEACLVDYCFVDYSVIPQQADNETQDALITIETLDGRTMTIPVTNIFDLQAGCYVDLSYVDLCVVVDYNQTGVNVYQMGNASIEYVLEGIHRNFVNRINITPLAMANYQTDRARSDPHYSERVAMYGMALTRLRQIEAVTDNILDQIAPGLTAFIKRQYKVAVDNLYGTLFNPHKWGNEAIKAMTKDQLKTWWITKWQNQGLDPNILSSLFDQIYPLIIAQGANRASERLNFLKKKLFG